MVSTEKCYKTDNTPVLRGSIQRGEFLYQVRVYMERAHFLSSSAGTMRMRVLLGFIETKAVVIDAVIKNEGLLHYLSVICSSRASPSVFSAIMKKTAPTAIIEELDSWRAEECISAGMVRDDSWSTIPYAGAIETVYESRKILMSLLLEYRALMADFRALVSSSPPEPLDSSLHSGSNLLTSVLIFEKEGMVCAIPEFQVEKLSEGANGSSIIQLHRFYGQRLLVCDDLLMVRDIDILQCAFVSRTKPGIYLVDVAIDGAKDGINLVIPAFL